MEQKLNFWNLEVEKYWSAPKKENLNELTKKMIFSGDYIGARKVDGFFSMMVKDNTHFGIRSRDVSTVTKKFLNKIDWVPHLKAEYTKLPNRTVLVGELYFPKNEGSKNVSSIMGCLEAKAIKRQEEGDKLHYYIFDVLAFDGVSLLNKSLEERIKYFSKINKIVSNEYIHTATYYEGQRLWDYIGWALDNDYEGVVIQRRDGLYSPGKRIARKSLKIKKEIKINIKAFLTGRTRAGTCEYEGTEAEHWNYWLNTRTGEFLLGEKNYDDYIQNGLTIPITKNFYFDLPASIEFGILDENNKEKTLCWVSNITDEIKNMIKDSPTSCRGKEAIISAMEIDKESGNLRHSKIVKWL